MFPTITFKGEKMAYSFSVEISANLDDAVEWVTEKLKDEGFGILVDIDVQKTLKEKIDVDRKGYRILGACNPMLANQAINAEPDIGVLLPCNVLVRETDNKTVVVSFMDPLTVLGLVENSDLSVLGGEVRDSLLRVRDALS